MPTREDAPIGAPCWVDLFTSDPDASCAFYSELLGWTAESAGEEYGGYINFSKGDARVAGAMRNDGSAGVPDTWNVYLASTDAEATAAAAAANGGEVIVPASEVMGLGSMAVVSDPGGAAIGIWQPGEHKGFGVLAEPGSASWFELHTRDYDASVAFYKTVFGWDAHAMSDAPEFRYTTLFGGEEAAAGIMDAAGFLPEGAPGQWSVYFGVEDADAAAAKIADLGGKVTQAAEDTPYGRLAAATDPTGAEFKVVQSPQG